MNQSNKRFHPAWIAIASFSTIKNSIAGLLFLFVIKINSTSTWVIWGRYIFIIALVCTFVFHVLKWFSHRYEIKEHAIVLKEGVFVKKQRTISFERIQNHHTKTTFLHKWFGLTSLTLETGTVLEDGEVVFPVLTVVEKQRILSYLEKEKEAAHGEGEATTSPLPEGRRVHFRSTKKDIFKASFTSLSFLAIFPILLTIYTNVADYFSLEDTAESALDYLLIHWWMLIVLFFIALSISIKIGYVKTSIKYGNFEISDDKEKIYVKKGIGSTTNFVIPKHKVQAIVLEEPILKRMLGLVSIKLVSVGAMTAEEKETSSLYPFMPKEEAFKLIGTLLPSYTLEQQMDRFPLKVLWYKLLVPYYITIIAAVGLFIFKPEWLWAAGIMFVLAVVTRILDYVFTSYRRLENTVQIRKGGWSTTTFVTHSSKIQEVSVEHSWLQRKFGIATLTFHNRANPSELNSLAGVSREEASAFFTWFQEKRKERVKRKRAS
ncbi:Bacterial membrane flanked domain protein [Bacillus sp. THAF10]|uniref:PH domain-containing protein n=1 Tax=Bacillus sp. THAF10 TaxID=2587848 RepID=UPI0012679294|nr:PH domain-containing protein [Bacillus sp. THAF10]QFT91088.1 Bacterial membrane flanked domain protein [Bacillus sp. THAF10]